MPGGRIPGGRRCMCLGGYSWHWVAACPSAHGGERRAWRRHRANGPNHELFGVAGAAVGLAQLAGNPGVGVQCGMGN